MRGRSIDGFSGYAACPIGDSDGRDEVMTSTVGSWPPSSVDGQEAHGESANEELPFAAVPRGTAREPGTWRSPGDA